MDKSRREEEVRRGIWRNRPGIGGDEPSCKRVSLPPPLQAVEEDRVHKPVIVPPEASSDFGMGGGRVRALAKWGCSRRIWIQGPKKRGPVGDAPPELNQTNYISESMDGPGGSSVGSMITGCAIAKLAHGKQTDPCPIPTLGSQREHIHARNDRKNGTFKWQMVHATKARRTDSSSADDITKKPISANAITKK